MDIPYGYPMDTLCKGYDYRIAGRRIPMITLCNG